MDTATFLPILLGLAWLLPLASFALIVLVGPRMGRAGVMASYVATGAILGSLVCSVVALGIWVFSSPADASGPRGEHGAVASAPHEATAGGHAGEAKEHAGEAKADAGEAKADAGDHASAAEHQAQAGPPRHYTGDWYTLGRFGALAITVSYYIDALTIGMFAMVTAIATCIHFYSIGYMHDELDEVVDHEVTLSDGRHLH
ncbi:MAG: NADH-quinone oxidoreductase subunit L, partial [Pirellulales bacterium]